MPLIGDLIRTRTLRKWVAEVVAGKDPLDWQILVKLSAEGAGFGYIPIPKAANSTLRTALLPCYGLLPEDVADIHRDPRIDKRPTLVGTLPLLNPDAFLFTVIRHPADRILSAWSNKIHRSRVFGHARRLGIRQHTGFRAFLEVLAQVNPLQLDSHFKPQHILLHYALADPRLVIYRTETLSADMEDIARRIKLNTGFEIARAGRENSSATDARARVFSTESKRLIELMYRQDFELFGYDW